ncbi:ATP-binding protein [Lentzea sp. HUAS12]|uniref:ATP-binding protein n=1 Tax=Lentzea sp. HUAS12 TaxID=2951806 RepID=UPI0020A1B5D3|nr:ATP-binding protein [Lentzea sp. HUAS12]USX52359.1 ATP-binding protein [Lentzea sp. HUAS12]
MRDVLVAGATGGIRGRDDVPPRFRPPAPPRHFVGRDAELAGIRAGVTVLHGASGAGKTALALKWLRDRGSGAQLYVDLAAHDLGRVLRAFGLDAGPADEQAVFRGLVTRRQFTLLLDNADSAEQVTPLLPASGTVLVTSRSRLALPGAREIAVGPLPDDGRLGPLLDLSYVELGERQARLYRLCAWEPGAFGVPVAAAIAGEPECDVEDALDDLVEKSLLTEVGDDAFRFHDLVRAHARAMRYQ